MLFFQKLYFFYHFFLFFGKKVKYREPESCELGSCVVADNIINATSCSQADVQSAIDLSVNGTGRLLPGSRYMPWETPDRVDIDGLPPGQSGL